MYLILPAGLLLATVAGPVMAFVPAPLAGWHGLQRAVGPAPRAADEYAALSVGGGGIFQRGQTWAHAASTEVLRDGLYAEASVEHFYGVRRAEHLAGRVGYLFNARQPVAGGVTLGYRYVRQDPGQRGLEVGLPLLLRNRRSTVRLDPTYVLARHGVLWSWRGQFDGPIGASPYFVGVGLLGRSMPLRDIFSTDFAASAVTVLVGVRLGRPMKSGSPPNPGVDAVLLAPPHGKGDR